MPGFGPPSAPVTDCGSLGFFGAPGSYRIDYSVEVLDSPVSIHANETHESAEADATTAGLNLKRRGFDAHCDKRAAFAAFSARRRGSGIWMGRL